MVGRRHLLYIMLSGMPPFWGRTDGEIFDRVLNEPVDLKIEPWPEVSQQGEGFGCKVSPCFHTTSHTVWDATRCVAMLLCARGLRWWDLLRSSFVARFFALTCVL